MKNYIETTLANEYELLRYLHRSKTKESRLYRHQEHGSMLVVRASESVANRAVYHALKRVRHRNLLEIYDILDVDDRTFIFEEYVDGITLQDSGIMKPLGAKRVVIQLCDALSALHHLGIVHRDVTLSNIMLTKHGIVKLIDFDISEFAGQPIQNTATMGTVGFAPHEQYAGAADTRTDLFAVGVVANLLLTGKHPSAQMYSKGKLGAMIDICTQIQPDKRFSSAEEIIRFLE